MCIWKVCRRSVSWIALSLLAIPVAWAVPPASPCVVPTPTCYTATGTATGPNGTLSAQAIFQISGSELTVTLSNTALSDVLVPAEVLTAVGFTLKSGSALTTLSSTSGTLSGGSTVFYDPDGQPAGGVVGGEYAYASGINFQGAQQGISSAGFGIFGDPTFPGADLSTPTAVNGLNYGILSAGDDTTTGNTGVTGSGGLIKDTVQFKLAISGVVPVLNAPGALNGVVFQWGTALSEPSTRPAPVPGTATLLGAGVLGLLLLRRRKFA